jgi:hypothetical protein
MHTAFYLRVPRGSPLLATAQALFRTDIQTDVTLPLELV